MRDFKREFQQKLAMFESKLQSGTESIVIPRPVRRMNQLLPSAIAIFERPPGDGKESIGSSFEPSQRDYPKTDDIDDDIERANPPISIERATVHDSDVEMEEKSNVEYTKLEESGNQESDSAASFDVKAETDESSDEGLAILQHSAVQNSAQIASEEISESQENLLTHFASHDYVFEKALLERKSLSVPNFPSGLSLENF